VQSFLGFEISVSFFPSPRKKVRNDRSTRAAVAANAAASQRKKLRLLEQFFLRQTNRLVFLRFSSLSLSSSVSLSFSLSLSLFATRRIGEKAGKKRGGKPFSLPLSPSSGEREKRETEEKEEKKKKAAAARRRRRRRR